MMHLTTRNHPCGVSIIQLYLPTLLKLPDTGGTSIVYCPFPFQEPWHSLSQGYFN